MLGPIPEIDMPTTPNHLSAQELQSSVTLSSVFGLRMLGLFLVLPVFAVFAKSLPGGDDTFWVGLTLGIYGLTQGILQIPFGIASDRLGRTPVIVFGLVVFALGSVLCAVAPNIQTALIGRAIQGTGAISAAVTAMLADSVRPASTTSAMAFIGSSIGITFAFSLVGAPVLAAFIGVPGLFWLTAALCVIAIGVMLWAVPPIPKQSTSTEKRRHAPWPQIVFGTDLLRLNLGIFWLHISLMALFVAVPLELAAAGLCVNLHWAVYLPSVLIGFAVMMPLIHWAERNNRLKPLFLGAVFTLIAVFSVLQLTAPSPISFFLILCIFFAAFNVLEACLPTFVAKTAPENDKGLALGVYNTTQSIGLFVGAASGGWMYAHHAAGGVYVFCAVVCLIWFAIAWRMRVPAKEPSDTPVESDSI